MSQAKIAVADAIHMNTNISVPSMAPILSSATEVKALRMMMNMTVATTVATVMKRAARKVKIMTRKAHQREKMEMGWRNIMTNARQTPERKRPNIQCETTLMRWRMLVTSAGRVTSNRSAAN